MLKTTAVFILFFHSGPSIQAQQLTDTNNIKHFSFNQKAENPLLVYPAPVPANLAAQRLPFFCDKEYKLEKLTKIPFRFRLGSVDYCDKMEGKRK